MCLSHASSRAATVTPDNVSRPEQMACYPLTVRLRMARAPLREAASVLKWPWPILLTVLTVKTVKNVLMSLSPFSEYDIMTTYSTAYMTY